MARAPEGALASLAGPEAAASARRSRSRPCARRSTGTAGGGRQFVDVVVGRFGGDLEQFAGPRQAGFAGGAGAQSVVTGGRPSQIPNRSTSRK